jgi:hypothetical protein
MKICHSYILLCDPSESSVNFLERQVENIIKFSISPNILLIVNRVKESEKVYDLVDKYNLNFCNIDEVNLPMLEDYLKNSITI